MGTLRGLFYWMKGLVLCLNSQSYYRNTSTRTGSLLKHAYCKSFSAHYDMIIHTSSGKEVQR